MLKKILKLIFIILLIPLVFYLGAEAGYQLKHKNEQWKSYRAGEKFNKAIADMFLKDTYGGKTPEETYNLFIDALKKEDIDLAIKYFVLDPERREKYLKEFNELKENKKLEEYAKNLPKWEELEQMKDDYNDWEGRARVEWGQVVEEPITVYDPSLKKERVLPPGIYGQSIIFTKNINSIWKISSL